MFLICAFYCDFANKTMRVNPLTFETFCYTLTCTFNTFQFLLVLTKNQISINLKMKWKFLKGSTMYNQGHCKKSQNKYSKFVGWFEMTFKIDLTSIFSYNPSSFGIFWPISRNEKYQPNYCKKKYIFV